MHTRDFLKGRRDIIGRAGRALEHREVLVKPITERKRLKKFSGNSGEGLLLSDFFDFLAVAPKIISRLVNFGRRLFFEFVNWKIQPLGNRLFRIFLEGVNLVYRKNVFKFNVIVLFEKFSMVSSDSKAHNYNVFKRSKAN